MVKLPVSQLKDRLRADTFRGCLSILNNVTILSALIRTLTYAVVAACTVVAACSAHEPTDEHIAPISVCADGEPCLSADGIEGACVGDACCTGCLNEGACAPGDDDLACGDRGRACDLCLGGSTCHGGACVECVHDATCIDDDDNPCTESACEGYACVSNPLFLAGCYAGNAFGYCLATQCCTGCVLWVDGYPVSCETGLEPAACGSSGAPCEACDGPGQACDAGTCNGYVNRAQE